MYKYSRLFSVRVFIFLVCAAVSFCVLRPTPLRAQFGEPEGAPSKETEQEDPNRIKAPPQPPLPEPTGAKRLDAKYPVWIDPKEKTVIVDGQICLRRGMLEMFACTRNTKEHEAIVSANTKAQLVHAGLLGLGAQPGHPARFQPEYKPPEGTEIDVTVEWRDAKGVMQKARAQDWIMDVKTKRMMAYPFVFGGSSIWVDPDTGKQHYQAEGGDFVCVSNFGTAMLDIPVKSSQSNEELEFEAYTEKIPLVGTSVRLVFRPKLDAKAAAAPKEEGGGGKVEGGAKEKSAPRSSKPKAK
jgi:hypothetical protein